MVVVGTEGEASTAAGSLCFAYLPNLGKVPECRTFVRVGEAEWVAVLAAAADAVPWDWDFRESARKAL